MLKPRTTALSTSVFKFMSGEQYHLEALRNEQVFFSNFFDLNDPYEGLLNFSKEGVNDSLRMALLANGLAKQHSCSLTQGRRYAERFRKKHGLEAMRNNVDKITEQIFQDYRDKHLMSRFVLSLSRQVEENKFPAPLTNMMMWSHYANGMRGMCVEYDYFDLLNSVRAENTDLEVSSRKVVYSESALPVVKASTLMQSYIKDEGEAGTEMINAFCTKAWAWRYENEVRLLGSNHGLVNFDRSAIKRIFVSYKNPKLLHEVQVIVRDKQMKIPIFVVSSMPDTYGFGFSLP